MRLTCPVASVFILLLLLGCQIHDPRPFFLNDLVVDHDMVTKSIKKIIFGVAVHRRLDCVGSFGTLPGHTLGEVTPRGVMNVTEDTPQLRDFSIQ